MPRFARAEYGYGQLPDVIAIYRAPILAICDNADQVRSQVYITLLHEIGHYYGISDEQLHELGWA
ncbi:MAG TPA: metallopeptidase family protein [Candidatus Yaniella excrementigallinarum]|nr:metallopeptidase family protein [Candidatus Yaniella excrementigallinarum]